MTTVSVEQLDRFFCDLKPGFETATEDESRLAPRFNVFRWLSPELTLSWIIRELLDPNGVHGQGDLFLGSFISFVGDKAGLGNLGTDRNAPLPKCEEVTKYTGNPLRRLDITLRPNSQFTIGIENKPWAKDQPNWVADYSDHLARCGDSYLLIYMTLNGCDPSGDRDQAKAAELEPGKKFLKVSYKEDIKAWLEVCCQICRADKVRSFLRDFIDYVKGVTETEMLSERNRTIVDYICDQPSNRIKIAYSVASTLREVQRRIVADFQAALVQSLGAEVDDDWQVTPIPREELLEKWNVFKVSKRHWVGRFALALSFEGRDCVGLTFGIFKRDENAPHIRGLRSRMDEATGITGREWPHWEWEFPVDQRYDNWNAPDTLERLAAKNDALHYFVGWFLKMQGLSEAIIDDECRSTT